MNMKKIYVDPITKMIIDGKTSENLPKGLVIACAGRKS